MLAEGAKKVGPTPPQGVDHDDGASVDKYWAALAAKFGKGEV